MSYLPNVIICGKMASGKTYLKDLIMEIFPEYEHRAFGNKVKEIACDLFNMDMENKNRDLLVAIGSKMREIDPDVWAKYVFNQTLEDGKRIIIDDLRYDNELKTLLEDDIDADDVNNWFIIKIDISPELQMKRLQETYPNSWETHYKYTNHHSEAGKLSDQINIKYDLLLDMDEYESLFPGMKSFNDYYKDIIRFELTKNN